MHAARVTVCDVRDMCHASGAYVGAAAAGGGFLWG